MQGVLETLGNLGVVPVVKIERADDAVPLGRALIAGGLRCAEITFRTNAAVETIRRIASELPEIVIGAGTVLSVDQAEKAVTAHPASLSRVLLKAGLSFKKNTARLRGRARGRAASA